MPRHYTDKLALFNLQEEVASVKFVAKLQRLFSEYSNNNDGYAVV